VWNKVGLTVSMTCFCQFFHASYWSLGFYEILKELALATRWLKYFANHTVTSKLLQVMVHNIIANIINQLLTILTWWNMIITQLTWIIIKLILKTYFFQGRSIHTCRKLQPNRDSLFQKNSKRGKMEHLWRLLCNLSKCTKILHFCLIFCIFFDNWFIRFFQNMLTSYTLAKGLISVWDKMNKSASDVAKTP
jgi:hypothetical protein